MDKARWCLGYSFSGYIRSVGSRPSSSRGWLLAIEQEPDLGLGRNEQHLKLGP